MKTKNILALIVAIVLVACVTGCKSDDELGAKPAKEMLRVLNKDAQFLASQETFTVEVVADCHWKVEELDYGTFNQTQFLLTPTEGIGDKNIVVNCDQNVTTSDRTATFTLVSDGGLRQKVTIRQTGTGGGLNLSESVFKFAAEPAGEQTMKITANTRWEIQIPGGANWLHLSKTSGGSGSASEDIVTITVDNAVSDASRSALLSIKYGENADKYAQFEVTQDGMAFVSLYAPEQLDRFGSRGGEQVVYIESNAEWHAFIPSNVEWLHFNDSAHAHKISGVGSRELFIRCDENRSSSDRLSAIVVIAGSKNPTQAVVLVEQTGTGSPEPMQLTVNLSSLNVLRESASLLLNILSDEQVGEFGVVYSTDTEWPELGNAEAMHVGRGGTSQGVPVELNGLQEGTTYFIRGFVQKAGSQEVVYSDPIHITTLTGTISMSDLTSMYVSNTSAEFHYSFVSDTEVIDYGLVYSMDIQEPTRENAEVYTAGEGGTSRNVLAVLEGLNESTRYYVRAYVLTQRGFVYSANVVTITTSSSIHEPGESDNPDPQLARKY